MTTIHFFNAWYVTNGAGNSRMAVLGCVPFGESKNGFLIQDLPDLAVERNAKSEIGSVTLVTVANAFNIRWRPLKR